MISDAEVLINMLLSCLSNLRGLIRKLTGQTAAQQTWESLKNGLQYDYEITKLADLNLKLQNMHKILESFTSSL